MYHSRGAIWVTDNLAVGWFSNAYDVMFHNSQDVVATSIDVRTGQARGIKRLTQSPNEPEADPLLGGLFIGDYIEGVLVQGNRYRLGYNANYRKVPLFGGFGDPFNTLTPLNQQDNYLALTGLN